METPTQGIKISDLTKYSASDGSFTVPGSTDNETKGIDDSLLSGLFGKSGLYENAIINPIFQIDQYGALPVSSPTNGSYYIDRYIVYRSSVGATMSLVTTSQPISGSNSIKIEATSSGTDRIGFTQRVEDIDYYDGKEVTFSCYVKSNSSNARLSVYDGTTHFTGPTHSGGGDWERLSITTTYSVGAQLSCFARIMSSSGGTVSITSGDYIESTGFKLEIGNVVTDFNPRSTGEELTLCQRYYYKFTDRERLYNYSSNQVVFNINTPLEMRTTPTISGTTEGASQNFEIRTTSGSAQSGFSYTSVAKRGTGVALAFSKTSHGLTDGVLYGGTKGIAFSAEV